MFVYCFKSMTWQLFKKDGQFFCIEINTDRSSSGGKQRDCWQGRGCLDFATL
jgi:hypothetical protein